MVPDGPEGVLAALSPPASNLFGGSTFSGTLDLGHNLIASTGSLLLFPERGSATSPRPVGAIELPSKPEDDTLPHRREALVRHSKSGPAASGSGQNHSFQPCVLYDGFDP
jgi:hypothetical protein